MIRSASASAAVLLALSLAACASAPSGPMPLTPTSRYTLQVEPGLDRIALAVHEQGLSPNQQDALGALGSRFAYEGAPALVVEVPAGGDPVAGERGWDVRRFYESQGVPPHLVVLQSYPAPNPRAPILVGFQTVRAHVPQCGQSWSALTATGSNTPSSNFGCAITANMAAQIANPRDILTPRDMTPPDGNRRATVFDNYRKGDETSAAQEPLVGRDVAQAVE